MNPECTVEEAKKLLREFLDAAGARELCSCCPGKASTGWASSPEVNTGCCGNCSYLVPGQGCSNPSLTCLKHGCSWLFDYLKAQGLWESFQELRENVPYEPWDPQKAPPAARGKRYRPNLRLCELTGDQTYHAWEENDPRWEEKPRAC